MSAPILNVFVPDRLVTFQLSLPVAGFIKSIMKTKKTSDVSEVQVIRVFNITL